MSDFSMGLLNELTGEVESIFTERWTTTKGQKLPDDDGIQLGNDAVTIECTVL